MKINFKSCLQTIITVLIFGFIGYHVLPSIFSPSETANTTTTLPSATISPVTITTSSIVTTVVETIVSSAAPEPSLQSTEVINREFKWDYGDSQWAWTMQIPKELYDYYKGLPRSPTSNYSIYVTHPLDDSIFDKLVVSLKNNAQKKGFTEFQTVSFAAAFVQSLTYTSDSVTTGYDEYPRYPLETLVDNGGDCEDTAILTASLIRALGYGTVLLTFDKTTEGPGHVAVGVKGGEGIYGSYYEDNDSKYYYLETTSTGWEIGQIPDDYRDSSAHIYAMMPIPILTHDWTTEAKGLTLELKVTVNNLGSAKAEDVYVYTGFDAGNDQVWNHQESPLFDVDVNGSMVATLYLTPPSGKYTRLVIQIVYDGYAVDESFSKWYNTY